MELGVCPRAPELAEARATLLITVAVLSSRSLAAVAQSCPVPGGAGAAACSGVRRVMGCWCGAATEPRGEVPGAEGKGSAAGGAVLPQRDARRVGGDARVADRAAEGASAGWGRKASLPSLGVCLG